MIPFRHLFRRLSNSRPLRLLVATLCSGFAIGTEVSAARVEVIAADRITLLAGADRVELPLYSSLDTNTDHPGITRLVVGIHGATRRADVVFNALRQGLEKSGQQDSVWLIAPQFLYRHDLDSLGNPAGVPIWRSLGWVRGDDARDPENWALSRKGTSSFAILDALILTIAGKCPDLREIVIAGHSAGGQTVQRYAATTMLAEQLNGQSSPKLRFLIANPAGYLYFDERRPVGSADNRFSVPGEATSHACSGYNNWHWGLENRKGYVARKDAEAVTSQYLSADVLLVAGEADTLVNTDAVSGSCEAMLQGANRLQRARCFQEYITSMQAQRGLPLHGFVEVDSTGHEAFRMLTSPQAVEYLFGCDQGKNAGETKQ